MENILYLNGKDGKVNECLSNIEKENSKFYQFIYEQLIENENVGISSEMLTYLSEHAREIDGDAYYLDMLCSFAVNIICSVEHMKFIIDYFQGDIVSEENKINSNDFFMLFNAALEKKIPLETLKDIMIHGGIYEIYDAIEKYEINSDEDKNNLILDEGVNSSSLVMEREHNEMLKEPEVVNHPSEISYSDMFSSIVSVVTYENQHKEDSVSAFKARSEGINANISKASSDLAVCIAEMTNEMQNDKTTIKKLEFMLSIQQQMFSSLQGKLNIARNEIARLNNIIKENEEAERNRIAINNKIAELSSLSDNFLRKV